MNIYQGDQYAIPFEITKDGQLITPDMVSKIEFAIGDVIKTYPDQASYDDQTGEYLCPITQEETFAMEDGAQTVQVRIQLSSGDVFGSSSGKVNVKESISKAVL